MPGTQTVPPPAATPPPKSPFSKFKLVGFLACGVIALTISFSALTGGGNQYVTLPGSTGSAPSMPSTPPGDAGPTSPGRDATQDDADSAGDQDAPAIPEPEDRGAALSGTWSGTMYIPVQRTNVSIALDIDGVAGRMTAQLSEKFTARNRKTLKCEGSLVSRRTRGERTVFRHIEAAGIDCPASATVSVSPGPDRTLRFRQRIALRGEDVVVRGLLHKV